MSQLETVKLELRSVNSSTEDVVAFLFLNRPEAANAFSAQMMEDIASTLTKLKTNEKVRTLVITGAGKHFSAGADLSWMKDSSKLSEAQNKVESAKLVSMFESIVDLPFPVISVVTGATFGGALGIVACSDISIATERAKFCLSETKLGLLPAVILPYLGRKMHQGQLRRLGLTAKLFQGKEALEFGLVEIFCQSEKLHDCLIEEINLLLSCGKNAQQAYKTLHLDLIQSSQVQSDKTVAAIASARKGDEAQQGLGCFFEKKPSPWVTKIEPSSLGLEPS